MTRRRCHRGSQGWLHGAALALAAGSWLGPLSLAHGATVSIACAAVGIEYQLCREGAEAWARKAGHQVRLIQTPNLANERLALFQQLLASRSPDIDVFQIDVIWPGILGRHFLDLRPYFDEQTIAGHFAEMVANNTVGGELKAMPWYGDAGLLYYRKDLLGSQGFSIPQTWDELARVARAVVAAEHARGRERLVGLVFQGKAYEGLTCNGLEWIASHGGGRIVGADGRVDLTNPQAVEAIETAASWIGDVAPRGVLNYAEEDARGVFQAGHAVFMRNWPYAWALLNSPDSPVKGLVGVAPLPHGGTGNAHVSALGGGGLAVSRYSQQPAIAADLVGYLTGLEEQVRRAVKGAANPTQPAAFDDPRVQAAQPFLGELRAVFTGALARPSRIAGAKYNRLSTVFWNAVHDTLAGRGTARENLARAERQLERLSNAGRW